MTSISNGTKYVLPSLEENKNRAGHQKSDNDFCTAESRSIMKRIILILIAISLTTQVYSQTSMNAGGASTVSRGLSLSYSIGQVFSGTLSNQKRTTQDIQQAQLNLDAPASFNTEETSKGFNARVFPNPTKDNIYVEFVGNDIQYKLSVCDLSGKIHKTDPYDVSSESNKIRTLVINVSNLPRGHYVINVLNRKGKKTGYSFKFLKE